MEDPDDQNVTADVDSLTRQLELRLHQEIPSLLRQLLAERIDLTGGKLHLMCSLLKTRDGSSDAPQTLRVASFDIPTAEMATLSGSHTPSDPRSNGLRDGQVQTMTDSPSFSDGWSVSVKEPRPNSRHTSCGFPASSSNSLDVSSRPGVDRATRKQTGDRTIKKKDRTSRNANAQLSTLDRFIGAVWDNIFSSMEMNPVEVIKQWQALESGQPKLLHDADTEINARGSAGVESVFGRMNLLTRNISHTSRTCRSLEVIVQSHWVDVFDDRVAELSKSLTREKAKKATLDEACADFKWSEKELRNKMAVWRGYNDIKKAGGWAALVFAGMGLYRFCKYRISFSDSTFHTLRQLRHRFEVAADTIHPQWRSLLAIVGLPTECKYDGHPHDWVVCGPGNEAIPLAKTYEQWDKDFHYEHIEECAIDEETWGLLDPRTISSSSDQDEHQCATCGESQSHDPRYNACACFPSLYGMTQAGRSPVQVFRTPNGKNNGLIACSTFEQGTVIGEFVGKVTSGLSNLDVMVGQTERATYQIWQGRQGNHIRFVNHSCQPNSQFEKFVWLGTQRIVLVSKGIRAGEEITVDYSDTYWNNLDKECLCGQPGCRYRKRQLEPS